MDVSGQPGIGGATDVQMLWLMNCLNATLDANSAVRIAAEDSLRNASVLPGYGVALANVTVNKGLVLGWRQLAAVLLKQYVKQHWQEGDKFYVPPVASVGDKAMIRALLPQALDDPHSKIQTAVGMAIASIASTDWPEEWPDLMGFLLMFIGDQSDKNKVHGALRCLALFADDMDDIQLPPLVPVLFPALHSILTATSVYDASLRRRALIVLHSCISTLGVMSGAYQSQTKALVAPMLRSWLHEFALILSPAVPSEDPDDWGLRMEVLKSLQQIVENFPKIAAAEFSVILAPLWQTIVSGYKVYEAACIHGEEESYGESADSDGTEQSLEAFTIQLYELLLTVITSPRFNKIVTNVEDLVYLTIGYMQMTEEQVQTWSSDPNQYVADEDDETYNCRVSGILLLEELVDAFNYRALHAIIEAARRRIVEAAQARAINQEDWWKFKEASILAVGSVAGSLISAQTDEGWNFPLASFLDEILIEDIERGMELCPFLHGRVIWATAKFAPAMSNTRKEQVFHIAVAGLSGNLPAPIKIGACRALAEILPRIELSLLQPHSQNLFASLGVLLQEASDDTLHLVLETLQAAVKADERATVALESTFSLLLLNVLSKHSSDTFITLDCIETLEAIKNTPGCLEPMASRVLPVVGSTLGNFQRKLEQPGLIAGALDLLTIFLKKAPIDVIHRAYDFTFAPLVNIILQSDDTMELQNATESLAAFVREGGEALLSWENDKSRTVQMLLDATASFVAKDQVCFGFCNVYIRHNSSTQTSAKFLISIPTRLLSPELESSSAVFVGSFVVALVLHLSTIMAPYIMQLLTALLARLRTTELVSLKTELLFIISRLVHMSAPNVGQFVDLLSALPVSYDALTYLMTEWTAHQGDQQGAYRIKVSTTALALLLATGHPKLAAMSVQGYLMSNTSGVVTRTRAKVAPNYWTKVSLPSKLLSLLAGALLEIQEQKIAPEDEWEEIDDDGDGEGDGDEDEDEEKHRRVPSLQTMHEKYPSVTGNMGRIADLLQEEFEDGDYIEDPGAATDPLNQINLSVYLRDFMREFSQRDPTTFHNLYQELASREQQAIHTALNG